MVRKEQTIHTDCNLYDLGKVDFSDTYSTTNHQDQLMDLSRKIFTISIGWVKLLFRIRNAVVQFFGLKTEMPSNETQNNKVGDYAGFFRIYQITSNEVVLGADDRHLNFRVRIFNSLEDQYNIKVTTLVHLKNRLGRVYFFIIKPFHHLIVKRMVKQGYHVDPTSTGSKPI